MNLDHSNLAHLAKTVRMLSADAVERANSGHPGMPMGAADYASLIWAYHLNFNPKDTTWANRDRFVLSAGHGSMLLYSLLHLFGYDLPMKELENFRQWGSKTPGHPEFDFTPGVETTTGPLGQGVANGVGMALSGKMLQARYSEELFNYRVFGIVSDGDLMEGVAAEGASLAGHLKLDNLFYFYDDNEISIGGSTDVCFTESVPDRFKAYGWYVDCVDGHDFNAIAAALDKAYKIKDRPHLIVCRTTIGLGSPNKAGKSNVHGEPLGKDELKATKQALGWPTEPSFLVPKEVGQFCCNLMQSKVESYQKWNEKFNKWATQNPEKAELYKKQVNRVIPTDLKDKLLAAMKPSIGKKAATRNLSGQAIQVLAKELPGFIGGSADLEPSNKTLIKDTTDVQAGNFAGKNLRFGVREHGMASIVNGLAYTRAWIPFGATFLIFSDYLRPTLRLAALSHLQSLFVFTHDSFWVGEDGPTHEPIEQIASLRLIPGLYVFRPADPTETAICYHAAVSLKKSPSALLFTRQDLEPLEFSSDFTPDLIEKGAYILSGASESKLCIIATGSEVWMAQRAAKQLSAKGINLRVVSMPCRELFLKQDQSYQDKVIPPGSRRVTIESGTTIGWEKLAGANGLCIGIDHYGASAPGQVLAEKFGFTPDAIAAKIESWV